MKTGIERAKELFMQYSGNRFYMDLDGAGQEYDRYCIPKATEKEWRREYLSSFFEQKRYGRDALRSYALAVDFLKSDMTDERWKRALFYPLRSDWLDDVTILFMLPVSLRLAEKRAEKGKFARDIADEYRYALDGFVQNIIHAAHLSRFASGLKKPDTGVRLFAGEQLYYLPSARDLTRSSSSWVK